MVIDIPWEEDPLLLFKLFHIGIYNRAASRLCIKCGEVGLRKHFSYIGGGLSGVDQVVDEKKTLPVAFDHLKHLKTSLLLLGFNGAACSVAGDTDGINKSDIEFARN